MSNNACGIIKGGHYVAIVPPAHSLRSCHGGSFKLTTTFVAVAIGFPARVALCFVREVCACVRRARDAEGKVTDGSEMSGSRASDSYNEGS